MSLFSSRFNRLFTSVRKTFNRMAAKHSYDFWKDLENNDIAKSSNPKKAAVKWYYDVYQNNPKKRIKRKIMRPGTLVMFDYDDPLTKDTLEYWDRNPLVLVVEPYLTKNEVLRVQGINLHLLPPNIRKLVLYQAFYLYKDAYTAKLYTDKDALQVNMAWQAIKMQLMKYGAGFAFRRYAVSRQMNIIEFNQEDWTKAVYIPSRAYEKTSVMELEKMWREYVKKQGNKIATGGESHMR